MSQDFDPQNEVGVCADCGAEIWLIGNRAFSASPDNVLCFECSERRGGVYDEQRDTWTLAPDVSDLPDERRPHV